MQIWNMVSLPEGVVLVRGFCGPKEQNMKFKTFCLEPYTINAIFGQPLSIELVGGDIYGRHCCWSDKWQNKDLSDWAEIISNHYAIVPLFCTFSLNSIISNIDHWSFIHNPHLLNIQFHFYNNPKFWNVQHSSPFQPTQQVSLPIWGPTLTFKSS